MAENKSTRKFKVIRPTTKQEPDPEYLNDLTPPGFLSEGATKVWNEIAQDLRNARLLTKLDIPMLCMGCEALSKHRQLTKEIDCVDKNITSGSDKKDDWILTTKQSVAFKQAMAVFQQFGMSPAARTKIALQPQGDLFNETGSDYLT